MNCRMFLDRAWESPPEKPLSFPARAEMAAHLLFCPRCAGKFRKLETVRHILRTDFFPPPPALEESFMARLFDEEPEMEISDAPAGFSFRGWVIAGFIVLISLSVSYFGMDFINTADTQGSSFLLPLGLTTGAVLTGYGAFFIGSHLKELSARFRLH